MDSTTILPQIESGQADKEGVANALFDAMSPASFLGRNFATTTGLTWGYIGGKYRGAAAVNEIGNGTVSLTQSTTNYVEFNPSTGAVTVNTSGFTAGRIAMYSIVTGVSTVTSYEDYRFWGVDVNPLAPLSFASNANKTLTQAEASAPLMVMTSGVTLTATRDLIVPLLPFIWFVRNNTTGGQSIRVIGASGTGVTIANGSGAWVFADGTNIVRMTADA